MLLDTSGLLCLLHRSEPFHDLARVVFAAAQRRLAHSYILAEFVALAIARRIPHETALVFLDDLVSSPNVETVWADESLHREAMSLLHTRLDKSYSLCDAVSFILMRQRRVGDALTTDRHFEQEGFRRLLT